MDSLRQKRYPAATLTATALLFYLKDLHEFLLVEELAGRDLVSNYAFVELMKSNLLKGEIFSWSSQWFLGFPSFELYPPGFFVFTSLIDIATAELIGTTAVFKAVTFLSVFLTPLAFYVCFKQFFGEKESFVGSLFSLLFLFVHEPISQAYLVLSTGLVAQGFSFILTIAATGIALQESRNRKIAAGLLLGFAFLSHPFASVAGFLVIGFYSAQTGSFEDFLPALIGGLIGLPWLANAALLMRFTPSYTMPTAEPGAYIALVLPLAVLGGITDRRSKAIAGGFLALLAVSLIDLPVVTQELRFYTYSLGLGTFLAGLGAFRAAKHLSDRTSLDRNKLLVLMVIPALSLSVQAEVSELWSYEDNADPLYDKLEEMEQGRVIVETENDSLRDAFVLQSNIPLRTDHYAVNDVHYDSSTSANYILTLESWISSDPLYNSICRTCGTEVSKDVVSTRLDSLGIRYVVVKTESSRERMQDIANPIGRYGDYWLFENEEGYRTRKKVSSAIALEGSFSDWRKVNDRLFASNATRTVYWTVEAEAGSAISMENRTAEQVLEAIRSRNQSDSVNATWTKKSQYPGKEGRFTNYNTVIDLDNS